MQLLSPHMVSSPLPEYNYSKRLCMRFITFYLPSPEKLASSLSVVLSVPLVSRAPSNSLARERVQSDHTICPFYGDWRPSNIGTWLVLTTVMDSDAATHWIMLTKNAYIMLTKKYLTMSPLLVAVN